MGYADFQCAMQFGHDFYVYFLKAARASVLFQLHDHHREGSCHSQRASGFLVIRQEILRRCYSIIFYVLESAPRSPNQQNHRYSLLLNFFAIS